MSIDDRLEYATAQDAFFDYCLWEYRPSVPWEGKFRSVNLLLHSFEVAGAPAACYDLVPTLRDAIGVSRTVFGVKWIDGRLRWEYYFYDYRRRERTRSIAKIMAAVRPLVRCDVEVNESLPYFMFSVDLNPEVVTGAAPLDEIHMYVGNVGSTVSSGICYAMTQTGVTLENFYFFFDAHRQLAEVRGKIGSSAHVDSARVGIDEILWPELRECRVIVVANKKGNDAVYFAGIDVDQLLFFLRRMRYPDALVAFVARHRSRLDHLRYDVGIDYRMQAGELVFLKSGYYGVA